MEAIACVIQQCNLSYFYCSISVNNYFSLMNSEDINWLAVKSDKMKSYNPYI